MIHRNVDLHHSAILWSPNGEEFYKSWHCKDDTRPLDKIRSRSFLLPLCVIWVRGVAGRENNRAMIMFINVLWNLSLDLSLSGHIFTSWQQNRLDIQYWILYCPTVCSLSISTLRAQTWQTQHKLKQYCIRPCDLSFSVSGSLATPGSTRATSPSIPGRQHIPSREGHTWSRWFASWVQGEVEHFLQGHNCLSWLPAGMLGRPLCKVCHSCV